MPTDFLHRAGIFKSQLLCPQVPKAASAALAFYPPSSSYRCVLLRRSFPLYSTFHEARPCDEDGNNLPAGAAPPEQLDANDWWPFNDRPHFEFTLWNFKKVQTSKDEVNELLRILAAQKALETGDPDAYNMFRSSEEILESIDAIPYGELPWTCGLEAEDLCDLHSKPASCRRGDGTQPRLPAYVGLPPV